tara:strand:- start:122 stop:304 length:183 start_codon:yes stop_codon:yes gene_type:complete
LPQTKKGLDGLSSPFKKVQVFKERRGNVCIFLPNPQGQAAFLGTLSHVLTSFGELGYSMP